MYAAPLARATGFATSVKTRRHGLSALTVVVVVEVVVTVVVVVAPGKVVVVTAGRVVVVVGGVRIQDPQAGP